jgi:hypothetical protein
MGVGRKTFVNVFLELGYCSLRREWKSESGGEIQPRE